MKPTAERVSAERSAAAAEVREILAEADRRIAEAQERQKALRQRDALEYELRGVVARLVAAKDALKKLNAEIKSAPPAWRADIEDSRDRQDRQVTYLEARAALIESEIARIAL